MEKDFRMLSLALFLNAEIADGLVKIAREKFNEIASVFGYSEADKSTFENGAHNVLTIY
jgi:hypothetical protein